MKNRFWYHMKWVNFAFGACTPHKPNQSEWNSHLTRKKCYCCFSTFLYLFSSFCPFCLCFPCGPQRFCAWISNAAKGGGAGKSITCTRRKRMWQTTTATPANTSYTISFTIQSGNTSNINIATLSRKCATTTRAGRD